MHNLSVVIICKNSAAVIGRTLASFDGLTDDIVVYDNGSTDGTLDIVKQYKANLFMGTWEGFGKTKNKANSLARHDWILSLDADEAIDVELKESLVQLSPVSEKIVYELAFKNFAGEKYLRFGEWGGDHHIRLFNRNVVCWNDAEVHEQLLIPADLEIEKLKGNVLHYTTSSFQEYEKKMDNYASLNGEKYFRQGKKIWRGKERLAAVYSFIKNYFFRLGFLDGKAGYDCARITSRYTFLKYKKLKELLNDEKAETGER